jgi:Lon protease-like protein
MAPAYNEDICPHWAERWEIRTQPLGCQVSTITSLTAIVTIFSTIVGVLLIGLVGVGLVRLRRYLTRKPLRITERLRAWRARLVSRGHDREQEPLLPEQTG